MTYHKEIRNRKRENPEEGGDERNICKKKNRYSSRIEGEGEEKRFGLWVKFGLQNCK